MEIGRLVLKICQVTPKGVLTFFKDYASMQRLMDEWKKQGLLKTLEEVKPIAIESSDTAELKKALKKFNDNVEMTGANFFLTMRGRCAETISFRDNMARVIILICAPYPNPADQSTKLLLKSQAGILKGKVQNADHEAKRTTIVEPTANWS
jgi:Rad3-related DNA helicase